MKSRAVDRTDPHEHHGFVELPALTLIENEAHGQN
jgi:hypothetical protein